LDPPRTLRGTTGPDTGGRRFDVVWALSFFSHIAEASFSAWIRELLAATIPGWLLMFNTHGEVTAGNMRAQNVPIKFEDSFCWQTSSDQGDPLSSHYGTNIVTFDYVYRLIAAMLGARLVRFHQAYWWEHQDLYILERRPG
jgi:hypothetical protein